MEGGRREAGGGSGLWSRAEGEARELGNPSGEKQIRVQGGR